MSTPTPDAGVRRARPDDAPAVGAVHAASWLADYTELMVATAGADVVGFVAFGPSADGDADVAADGEVVALLVDPGAQRRGHGSRLLNATVDTLREQGAARVRIWVPEVDEPRLAFVQAAGFAPDGAARVLDAAGDGTTTVREVRLSAAITPER